jgi:hypothetical protein
MASIELIAQGLTQINALNMIVHHFGAFGFINNNHMVVQKAKLKKSAIGRPLS